jgi:hypothetical protein
MENAELFIFLFKKERRNNYFLSLPTRPLLFGCGGSQPPDPASNTFINSKRAREERLEDLTNLSDLGTKKT